MASGFLIDHAPKMGAMVVFAEHVSFFCDKIKSTGINIAINDLIWRCINILLDACDIDIKQNLSTQFVAA